ncbi:MAG TPA: glycosyltransferase family 39 protein [Myxococcales bacterium]|nr:glycosyltransferase family 39 protein [Myxococcales bacterium]
MPPRRLLLAALLVACAARLPALLLGMEHYGDGPVRVEIAERWARSPHLWRGFSETFQFGPLHLTLLGGTLELWPDRLWAPRVFSVLCGLAAIWLLFRISLRLFGPAAAFVAALGLALSPLHIQASTTAASEAPFLALLLGAIDLLLTDRLVLSAMLLGAAGMVRYDGWLYVPLLAGWLLLRRVELPRIALYCALAALPVPLWLWQNARTNGDWLAPIHYIDRDHRALATMAVAWFGPLRWRTYCVVFWPAAVLLLSTPVLGLFSLAGAARALFRRIPGWELAAVAWIPAAYLTFRAAVLADFRPLSRFALVAATLSLPFAWSALAALPPRLRTAGAALAGALLVATPVALALASYGRNGGLAEWARALSPVSTVPPGIAQASRWLETNARPDDVLLLDSAWHYLDIPLAFSSGLPDERIARLRWPDFAEHLARTPPTLALLLYQGKLRWEPGAQGATEDAESFAFRELRFCIAQRFVYASIYRRCDLLPAAAR